MTRFQLAQLNIAHLKYAIDSPHLHDFVANIERINILAEQAPGFCWRYITPAGDTSEAEIFGADTIVNVSVWEDIPSLHNYVYRSAHVDIMKRRKEWFNHTQDAYSVLWWVPENHQPPLQEAKQRLTMLQALGPSADAFTFKKAFSSPNQDNLIDSELPNGLLRCD